MKVIFGFMTAISMFFIVSGCTIPKLSAQQHSVENRVILPPIGNFNDRMKNLADQLDMNAGTKDPASTFIVTSFTNLDRLGDTTALGRLISENLMSGLQMHKWQILEARLTRGIDVTAAGEFSLSRDIAKLRDEYKISGVVTGTYSVAEGNLTINARVINVNTGLLISSAQTYIPVTWLPDASFTLENSNKPMKIISDGMK
jgi:TolB-like protein